jgi:dTDP-glucose pyrophosphorylase
VTDLNNFYLKESKLQCDIIDWWIDAGTSFDELLRANIEVERYVKEGRL